MRNIHKRSAFSRRLKAGSAAPVKTVIVDPRVLEMRGPQPDVEVTVTLALLPEWLAFHRVEPAGYDIPRAVLHVKRY